MVKHTRKRGLGLFSILWSPFDNLLKATGESAQRVGATSGRIVNEVVGIPAGIGRSFAKHGNAVVKNVASGLRFTRRGRRCRSRKN